MALAVLVIWQACAPNPLNDLSISDSQTFITNYDQSVSFNSYKTFSISDSVYVINNNQYYKANTPRDAQIVFQVTEQLKSRGFKYVKKSEKPDIAVDVARVTDSYVGVTSSSPFSYGAGYWGYGGYGAYYPSYYSYYQVSETYWVIEMGDLKNVTQNSNKIKIIWNAQIRGNGIFDESAISPVIDAVFKQSAYLKTN